MILFTELLFLFMVPSDARMLLRSTFSNGNFMSTLFPNTATSSRLLVMVILSFAITACGGGEEDTDPDEAPVIILPGENSDSEDMSPSNNNTSQADQGVAMDDMGAPSEEDMSATQADMTLEGMDMGGTTEPPPPTPGQMLEASCAHAYDCGGRYYGEDRAEYIEGCRTASTNYWGDCPRRLALIDAFGKCSSMLTCDQIGNGSGFVPSEDKCGAEYDALRSSESCD
jgi:hypothetical protein